MPLYKVDFTDNIPCAASVVSGEQYQSLKEFGNSGDRTFINWYIVQADNEKNAREMAGKLVYQIWGDILVSQVVPHEDPAVSTD